MRIIIFENLREREKSQAIKELIEDSTPRQEFYLIVAVATGIATLGLILDSLTIVIGSMLIAPLLFPVSALGLSIAIHNYKLFVRSLKTFIFASVFGLITAFLLSLIFHESIDPTYQTIIQEIRPGTIYSLVAFMSGVAAAFAFAKPHLNISLTGVAISVSLIPPLAATAISLATNDSEVALNSLAQYFINFLLIVLANYLIFKFMDFESRESIADEAVKEEEKEVKQEEEIAEENERHPKR